MENTKFLKTVIFILLIINIGTLSFLWINHPPKDKGPHRGGEIGEYLMHELKFNPEQRGVYEQMREDHRNAVKALRDSVEQLRNTLFDQMGKTPTDTIHIHELADSLSHLQEKIEISTFYHFQKVRSICTPEQQIEFDQVIKEGLRMTPPPAPYQK